MKPGLGIIDRAHERLFYGRSGAAYLGWSCFFCYLQGPRLGRAFGPRLPLFQL